MTTIHVSEETKNKLISLKQHKRETYEDVVLRLIESHISEETKNKLISLRQDERETHEDVILRLIEFYEEKNNEAKGGGDERS